VETFRIIVNSRHHKKNTVFSNEVSFSKYMHWINCSIYLLAYGRDNEKLFILPLWVTCPFSVLRSHEMG